MAGGVDGADVVPEAAHVASGGLLVGEAEGLLGDLRLVRHRGNALVAAPNFVANDGIAGGEGVVPAYLDGGVVDALDLGVLRRLEADRGALEEVGLRAVQGGDAIFDLLLLEQAELVAVWQAARLATTWSFSGSFPSSISPMPVMIVLIPSGLSVYRMKSSWETLPGWPTLSTL